MEFKRGSNKIFLKFLIVILIFFSFIYIISGFYIVKPAEQAVVMRFGKYHRTNFQGPHVFYRFLENIIIINTERLERSSHISSMLTKDENVVTVGLEVQHRIKDVESYLFKLVESEKVLNEAIDSSLRQIIGSVSLDRVMTAGKTQVANAIQEQLQLLLDSYESGIYIATVALRDASVPQSVKIAFDDVIKAKEEKEQLKHQAEAYVNKIIPEAKGLAVQIEQEAKAYRYEIVYAAQGDTVEFNLLLPCYKESPEIVRTRLYIESFEKIFSKTFKVLLDLNKEGSFIYLPIDKIFFTKK